MTLPDLIITANKNLLTNKVRTLLTILAIFVGALALSASAALGDGVKTYLNAQLEQFEAPGILLILPGKDSLSFPISDNNELKKYNPDNSPKFISKTKIQELKSKIPEIIDIIPFYSTPIRYIQIGSGDKFQLEATALKKNTTYTFDVGSVPINDNEITISSTAADSLGFKNHKEALGKDLSITFAAGEETDITKSLKIVGVLQKSLLFNDNLVTSNFKSMVNEEVNASNPSIRDEYAYAHIVLDKNISTEKIETIKKKLTDLDYATQTYSESVKDTANQINVIIYGLYIFAAIVLLASSFGVINTLLMSVLERTKEIGLMRSLGMSKRGIFTIFSIEAISLGFWGSIAGVLVVAILSPIINDLASQNFLKGFDGFKLLLMTPLSALEIILVIMLITFIAGVFPSIKASKQDPINALRSE